MHKEGVLLHGKETFFQLFYRVRGNGLEDRMLGIERLKENVVKVVKVVKVIKVLKGL